MPFDRVEHVTAWAARHTDPDDALPFVSWYLDLVRDDPYHENVSYGVLYRAWHNDPEGDPCPMEWDDASQQLRPKRIV